MRIDLVARAGVAAAHWGWTALCVGIAMSVPQIALAALWPGDTAAAGEHSGKSVVDAVCGRCHATGADGAPKIGDEAAWRARAKQGLSSLTVHALEGIRKMPSHGGVPKLTDGEISRAITYMVNRSGGHWTDPIEAGRVATERTGEEVVKGQCVKCHQAGLNGAPRIGDREAWTARMKYGVDYLVRSAVHGHGGMPPRGGEADLTDSELRSAILYMFDPKRAAQAAPTAQATALSGAGIANTGPNHAVAGNVEVFLGVVSAKTLLSFPPDSIERTMHGGVPAGNDYFHVNVTLRDFASQEPINDAQVQVTYERKDQGGADRNTESLTSIPLGAGSYGKYIRLKDGVPYSITIRIRAPNSPAPVEAHFDHLIL